MTTDLEVDKFKIFYEYLDPGENCEHIKYHEPVKDKEEDRSDALSSPSFSSPASNPYLDLNVLALTNYFFFLSWLRLDSPLKHTVWLFNLSKSTVSSRYIITWVNFVYFKLGCVPVWSTKDIVIEKMPECFKATYPNTRVIIDCTELFCQKPSSLTIQSSLFSHYKHHHL